MMPGVDWSSLLLLFLITDAGVLVDCQRVPGIQWPEGCNEYEVGVIPPVRYYYDSLDSIYDLERCRSFCSSDTECGMFTASVNVTCSLYNMNSQIAMDHLTDKWHITDYAPYSNKAVWFSKTCPYDLGSSDPTCNSYTDRINPRQTPLANWMILRTYNIDHLYSPSECQTVCTLYPNCASVTYEHGNGIIWANCYLFNTTIHDLLAQGLTEDIYTYDASLNGTFINYDRYCGDGNPYIPGSTTTSSTTTTTTTTAPAPTQSNGITLIPTVWAITCLVIALIIGL